MKVECSRLLPVCASDTVRDPLGMAHARHPAHCRWQIKALGDKKGKKLCIWGALTQQRSPVGGGCSAAFNTCCRTGVSDGYMSSQALKQGE